MTDEKTSEALPLLRYRIAEFSVSSYHSEDIAWDGISPDKVNFNTKPTVTFDELKGLVIIDIAIAGQHLDDNDIKQQLFTFTTKTKFHVIGMTLQKIGDQVGSNLTTELLQAFVSIAVSSTRGALSIISGGRWLLPAIDVTKMVNVEPLKIEGAEANSL